MASEKMRGLGENEAPQASSQTTKTPFLFLEVDHQDLTWAT